MVANISAYRPKNKTVMHVLTITVALDMALSRCPLRVLNLATALRGQATVLRGQDSILPLQTTTSQKTTCRSSSIVTPIQIVILSTNTPYFVDKTVSNALLSMKTRYFVDKTESTGISIVRQKEQRGGCIYRPRWMSHSPGSNWRPARYECAALPTELKWLGSANIQTLLELSNIVR